MDDMNTTQIVFRARDAGIVVPGFNIPYLPMMESVVRALRDTGSFGLIMVARLEWVKFAARSPEAVAAEYRRVGDVRHTRLHLDHVPVVDEDGLAVDYEDDIRRAIAAGFESVMIDGSRLSLEENIRHTRRVVDLAHAAGVPVEGELGAVMGHEAGPLPPYDELFASGRGFTDPGEAARFVAETGVDWLSVAIGNVHGAISAATRGLKKVEARLDLAHLGRLRCAAGVPLVLHGGTGIPKACITAAIGQGIAKINVATAIRQPYERAARESEEAACAAAYDAVVQVVRDELGIEGSADRLGVRA
jgi:fructose-bisphosphate aldolase class II